MRDGQLRLKRNGQGLGSNFTTDRRENSNDQAVVICTRKSPAAPQMHRLCGTGEWAHLDCGVQQLPVEQLQAFYPSQGFIRHLSNVADL